MKISTKYSLIGIAALTVLSLVHAARKFQYGEGVVLYLMGVLPNVTAAIAIPFVLLSMWADQKPGASVTATRRVFVWLTFGAGAALIGWEIVQQSSRTLVFDTHDILATLVGLGIGAMLFKWSTDKPD